MIFQGGIRTPYPPSGSAHEHYQSVDRLDPDQARRTVGPDLGRNCLQRLSAPLADKGLKYEHTFGNFSAIISVTGMVKTTENGVRPAWKRPNLFNLSYDVAYGSEITL